MTKMRARGAIAVLALAAVLLAMVAFLPGFSLEAKASVVPTPTAEGISVTAIKITDRPEDSAPVYTGAITKGKQLNIDLYIYDTRAPHGGTEKWSKTGLVASALLNTGSFKLSSNKVSAGGYELVDDGTGPIGITYHIRFAGVEYTGVGNTFACDIFYSSDPTLSLFNYSIELNQCSPEPESSSSDDSSSSSEPIVKGTGFVLKSVDFGGSEVNAGASFDLNLSLLATNGTYSVENVSIEVTPRRLSLIHI